MTTYFTSDTHFFHRKINEYCPLRGFKTSEEHDEKLIEKWNKTVAHNDEIWVLGDFAFGSWSKVKELLTRLNGRIMIVPGNHDSGWYRKLANNPMRSAEMYPHMLTRKFNKQKVLMCHYPVEAWSGAYESKTVHFHGHWHNKIGSRMIRNRIDVGWDTLMRPIPFDEVMAWLSLQNNILENGIY